MANNCRKLYLLVWKNFILQIRRPIGTTIELVLPIGFLLLLIFARARIEKEERCLDVFDKTDIQKKSTNLFDYLVWHDQGMRLGYYPNDEKTFSLLKAAMSHTTPRLMLAQKSVANKTFESLDEVISDATENRNKYIGVVIFRNVKNGTIGWPKNIEYYIRLHHTTGEIYGGPNGWDTKQVYSDYVRPGASDICVYKSPFLALQYYIDSAIIRLQSNYSHGVSAARYVQEYPYPGYTYDSFVDMMAFFIPLMINIAFVYTAAMIVKEIVSEKQLRLTESMKMMGLPGWIHWTAWFIKAILFFLVIIIIQTMILKGGKIFEFSNGVLIFISLLLWVMASICSLFLVSSFCSIGTRGMLAASTLWFGSFAPFLAIQDPSQYDVLSARAKLACCLLPNTCLGIMVKTILRYEGEQIGVNWENVNKPVTVDGNFSLSYAFGMLILDCFIFPLITWYIVNVFPGEYGIPKPFYFPFQPAYWCPNRGVPFGNEGVAMSLGNENFEDEPNLEVGINIKNLRKVFKSAVGKKIAVDDLSLNIYKGQITALLGHNGAGKTTTLSILTGLFPPSRGDATVGGKSVLTDMDAIRDSLGLCPQHNVLFDRLTVKEHLQFFSALKGTPKEVADEEIRDLIRDIQLVEKSDERSATLSGGMKRKLSCAIALVGGSQTVILDEPTSGMDPYARRATWDLLQRYRGNKTIIITTHYMDEADYLGDRIAIMSEGNVRCCGSSLFLKKRFGVGYHLTLVKSPDFDENRTISLISDTIPSAKLVGNVAAEMSYILHEDSSKSFQELFRVLEDDDDQYGVTSFGVSVTTLEEVFLKVGQGETLALNEDIQNTGDQEMRRDVKDNVHIKDHELKSGFSLHASQFKAIFLKRFLNSKRQKRALFTQIFLPIGLVLIGFILPTILRRMTPEDLPSRKLTLDMLKVSDENLIAFLTDNSVSQPSVKASMKSMASAYFSSIDVQLEDISSRITSIINGNQGNDVNVLFSKSKFSGKIRINNKTACCKYQYLVLNRQCFDKSRYCHENAHCKIHPIARNTSFLQEYILEDSAKRIQKYFRKKVVGISLDDNQRVPTVWYSNQANHNLPSAYSAVNNIILKHVTKDKSYGIVTYNHPLPRGTEEKPEISLGEWSNTILIIFVILGSCALAASFIIFLIDEKTSKAKHVQFVSGVNSICYWGATYSWDYLNFLFPAIGIFILFAIFNVDDYKGELGSVFAVTLLYGLSMLPFVYILSFLFTSSLAGYGFIGMLVQLLSFAMYIAVLICNTGDKQYAAVAHIMHHVFLLFPTYSYPMALSDMALNYKHRRNCQKDASSRDRCDELHTFALKSPGIGYHCLYMFFVSIVYFFIILLIEENFFIGHLLSNNKNMTYSSNNSEDADVASERQKILSMPHGELSKSALVMKNLTKVYRTTGMVAVDHLSVGIPKGECFGLLGINGAGKTTAFGMLTGDLSISEGKAYLHGYDLTTQLKYVQQLIGYCPQFNALIGTMTGREMLYMFARLRGISDNVIDEVVDNAIDHLNLKGWADKLCGTYSGGNKRKLSTAIALVGNPSVIFLDEPTTGMDPASRRHLWNTLSDILTSGKSIVLTSHSMEECEALCTRLVIMVNGKFKCLGSIQHLKSRFGQGYTVMLKIYPSLNQKDNDLSRTNSAYVGNDMETSLSPVENVKSFMNTHFPGALLREEHQGLLQYQIVDRSIKLSQMFGILEENVDALGLSDYSVSQTSLEQVFLNFAKEQYSEDRVKQKTCCSCSCF